MSVRCHLDLLPRELKSRIVELIAEADARYRTWTQALNHRRDKEFHYHARIRPNALKVSYCGGIWQMSRVSQAWRALCAPYVFHTVDLARTTHATFVFDIEDRYGALFTNLRISSTSKAEQAVEMIRSLKRLPSITTLHLEADALPKLFKTFILPPKYAPLSPRSRTWTALSKLLGRIETLSMHAVRLMAEVDQVVNLCDNLTKLELVWATNATVTDLEDGTKAVGNLSQLVHLDLDSSLAKKCELDVSGLHDCLQDVSSTFALSSLTLTAHVLDASWLPLASFFAKTLVTLVFRSTDASDENLMSRSPPFFFSPDTCFPRLRKLFISALRPVSQPLFLSANRLNFPRVSSLSIGLNLADHVSLAHMPDAVVDHAKNLVRPGGEIRIYDELWAMPARYLGEAGVKFAPTDPFPSDSFAAHLSSSASIRGQKALGDADTKRANLEKDVERATQHLLHEIAQARLSGSDADWLKLERLLRDVEFDRIVRKS